MASNLRVDSIVPSTSGNVSIGTATGGVTIPGDLGIAGVLTYEDVTNIDSVGVITARDGLRVTGITTITSGNIQINAGGNTTQAIFSGNGGSGARGLSIITESVGAQDEGVILNARASGNTGRIKLQTNSTTALTVDGSGSNGNVTVNTGNLIMGTSGKGIDFSATANSSGTTSSEILDDYEEGSFNPILQNGNNGYRFQYGFYVKVGNAVHFTAFIEVSATPPSSDLAIGGLPFTSRNDVNAHLYVFPMLSNRTAFGTSGGLYARFYMDRNDTHATLYYPVNSSSSNFQTVNANLMNAANASNVWMSGTYFT